MATHRDEKHLAKMLRVHDDGLTTEANVNSDGRVDVCIFKHGSGKLLEFLNSLQTRHGSKPTDRPVHYSAEETVAHIHEATRNAPSAPKLNIVIHIVGSRGDVQPFVALAKELKEKHGHRVRLATHGVFKDFVEENGIEFFNLGGDPSQLMSYMVKNPGLLPNFESLKNGDVGARRKEIMEIMMGCWRSCIEPGDGMNALPIDDTEDGAQLCHAMTDSIEDGRKPFVADAIISNPPAFGSVHCGERLGVPIHFMFTMPWSPTHAFPHPLANITSTGTDMNAENYLSYALVQALTVQGLGDLVNRFRTRTLGLQPVNLIWIPSLMYRSKLPYTYCWSPALIPKPKDWGPHINIAGFFFLSLASSFKPSDELVKFLADGPPPVYIGFGSIVVDDPDAMTKMIFEAVKKAGVRALVSKGWGGLGADKLGIPEGVFMLGNTPHDWLFPQVSAVVHHGGAGTTAAGIAAGKPTVVVPFFGDQPFWGSMVARAGAGPAPIAFKQLTADKLANQIKEALLPEKLSAAQQMATTIAKEKGPENGALSFHNQLCQPWGGADKLRCAFAPDRAAAWRIRRSNIALSPLAAIVLGNEGIIELDDLKLYKPCEYDPMDQPTDPLTGTITSLIGTVANMAVNVAGLPSSVAQGVKNEAGKAKARHERQKSASGKSTPALSSPTHSSTEIPTVSSEKPSSVFKRSLDRARSRSRSPNRSPKLNPVQEDSPSLTPVSSDSQLKPHIVSERANSLDVPRKDSLFGSELYTSLTVNTGTTDGRVKGHDEMQKHAKHLASNTVSTSAHVAGHFIKFPMDMTLAIARGFHNVPTLYHDETVRKPLKVENLRTGLKAASKEFGQEMYDGVTGLVTQPMSGAKKDGVSGFFKGIGKGVGGFLVKPQAAIWGLPGYTIKGIYRELHGRYGPRIENKIIAERLAQGYDEWNHASNEECQEIVDRWHNAHVTLHKHLHRHSHTSDRRSSAQVLAEYEDSSSRGSLDSAYNKAPTPPRPDTPKQLFDPDADESHQITLINSPESLDTVNEALGSSEVRAAGVLNEEGRVDVETIKKNGEPADPIRLVNGAEHAVPQAEHVRIEKLNEKMAEVAITESPVTEVSP